MPAETLEGIIDPGLTELDVLIRQRQAGFNELPSAQSRNFLVIAWDSFKDPIFLLAVTRQTARFSISISRISGNSLIANPKPIVSSGSIDRFVEYVFDRLKSR